MESVQHLEFDLHSDGNRRGLISVKSFCLLRATLLNRDLKKLSGETKNASTSYGTGSFLQSL